MLFFDSLFFYVVLIVASFDRVLFSRLKRQSAIELFPPTESHVSQKITKAKSLPDSSLPQKYNYTFKVEEVSCSQNKYEVQTIDDCETRRKKKKKKKSKIAKAAKTLNNLNVFNRKEKD